MKIDLTQDLFIREKYLSKIRGFYHECELIKVLTGVRRCGKSSIMTLIMRELMKSRRSLSGEKKFYLSDLSFFYALNTDNRINFGPVLENIVYNYARSLDYSVSVGRFGKFECDFIVRGTDMQYAYIQVAYTIALSKETEDREYRPLESIKDNYPRYVITTDYLLQQRNGIRHVNLMDFISKNEKFKSTTTKLTMVVFGYTF